VSLKRFRSDLKHVLDASSPRDGFEHRVMEHIERRQSSRIRTAYSRSARLKGVKPALAALTAMTILSAVIFTSIRLQSHPATPLPETTAELQGIYAVNANEAWAAGWRQSRSAGSQTLIEHWTDGTWQNVTSPSPGSTENVLYDISGGRSSMWAVGAVRGLGASQTLILRWGGHSWDLVDSANRGLSDNLLMAVASGRIDDDAWAVGSAADDDRVVSALVEHWNGSTWSLVPTPDFGASASALTDVVVLPSGDVWVSGSIRESGKPSRALAMRWSHGAWTVTATPVIGLSTRFNALAGTSESNLWAAGSADEGGRTITLIARWNNDAWSITPSPNPGTSGNEIRSVWVAANGRAWAVGLYSNGSEVRPLAEVWNGAEWILDNPDASRAGWLNAVAAQDSTVLAVGSTSTGVDGSRGPLASQIHY
jgi:hypothetical protein